MQIDNRLRTEYSRWLRNRHFPEMLPDVILALYDVTIAERQWLEDFVARWETMIIEQSHCRPRMKYFPYHGPRSNRLPV